MCHCFGCILFTVNGRCDGVVCDLQFVLRYCHFLALTGPGDAYSEFLNSTDHAMMPWLRKFQVSTMQLDQHFLLMHADSPQCFVVFTLSCHMPSAV